MVGALEGQAVEPVAAMQTVPVNCPCAGWVTDGLAMRAPVASNKNAKRTGFFITISPIFSDFRR
jgi:hypothetical protein